jgi:tight adherence protein B
MRGLAALVAGAAAWVVVTRRVPAIRLPSLRLPPVWVAPAAIGSGIIAAVLALGILGVPAAAAAIGILAASIPIAASASHHRAKREALADAWPDLLAFLRARVVSGATLPEAFLDAADRSPEPLRTATTGVETEVMYGNGFAAALQRLRSTLEDPTADRVLATIETAYRSGGHRVGDILAALGVSVADELRLRKAHRAAMTEQRLTAGVALVAPWALLALTISTNPQAAAVYRSPTGAALISVGLALTGVGFLLARRTARLSSSPRVFR